MLRAIVLFHNERRMRASYWAMALSLGASAWVLADDAMACLVARPFDPDRVLQRMTAKDIVERASIIVEGVVVRPDSVAADVKSVASPMLVERVWKGDIDRHVMIRYNLSSSNCTHPPLFGTRIRLSTHRLDNGEISYDFFDVELPLDHDELNRLLQPYAGTVEDKGP